MVILRPFVRGFILAGVCFIIGCSGDAPGDMEVNRPPQTDPAVIRRLIPEAAGSPINELPGFTQKGMAPSLDGVKKESLTVAVLLLNFATETNSEDHREEFRLIKTDLPNPGKIAAACAMSEKSGYYSVIQPEYITDFSCEFEGDSAKGYVSFEAKDLYAGRVLFKSSRIGDEWRIVEFHMPVWDVVSRRDDKGRWSLSGSGAKMPTN